MNLKEINPLTLAYLGDAIYELEIRIHNVKNGTLKVNNLQKESIKYVSAKNQAKILKELVSSSFFTEEEIDLIKRARNQKIKSKAKNTDVLTYKHSTAFEAILAYIYFKDKKRFNVLMEEVIRIVSMW